MSDWYTIDFGTGQELRFAVASVSEDELRLHIDDPKTAPVGDSYLVIPSHASDMDARFTEPLAGGLANPRQLRLSAATAVHAAAETPGASNALRRAREFMYSNF